MVCKGANRWVLVIGRLAIKFPNPSSWESFLFGLLNNAQEAKVSRDREGEGRCPVLFCSWGAFVIVMPRADILTVEEFSRLDVQDYRDRLGLAVEGKPDSFGWLDGRIVAVDYGW